MYYPVVIKYNVQKLFKFYHINIDLIDSRWEHKHLKKEQAKKNITF